MREISVDNIKKEVARLCIESNIYLNKDIENAISKAEKSESKKLSKGILSMLLENANIARENKQPICQDTGMTIIFVDIGQDTHIVGGDLTTAINEGVATGYKDGYLRKSVVDDPLIRKNTGDNTPAVIHYDIVEGDKIKITVSPKGFGSENMSRLTMLTPSAGYEGVKKFVIDTVNMAGSNPCPPIIVGVGIGGTMERVALIAKKAMLRDVGTKNKNKFYAKFEEELLTEINKLNIGPAGFGGVSTALAVNIETFATHIAGLPVCVAIGCHVTRHAHVVL